MYKILSWEEGEEIKDPRGGEGKGKGKGKRKGKKEVENKRKKGRKQ